METSSVLACKTNATCRGRQRFSCKRLRVADEDDDDEPNDPLQELLKKTWNIWGVSPLFQFNYKSERHMKLYAKRLREELASLLPKEDVKYEVKFEVDESISPRLNSTDPPAIKIEVFAEDLNKKVEKCIYTGILMSWGSISEFIDETSVRLPLLLCRGNKPAIKAVNVTLSSMFDCITIQLSATEEDLRWLVPVALNVDEDYGHKAKRFKEDKGQVKFEYRIPGLSTTDDISFYWDIPLLIKLWNVVSESDDDDNVNVNNFLLKPVERFHHILQKQILQEAGLQLGFSKLIKISMPYLTIMDNRIKASTSDVLNKVLFYFNDKSTELLHSLNFDTTRHSSVSNT